MKTEDLDHKNCHTKKPVTVELYQFDLSDFLVLENHRNFSDTLCIVSSVELYITVFVSVMKSVLAIRSPLKPNYVRSSRRVLACDTVASGTILMSRILNK